MHGILNKHSLNNFAVIKVCSICGQQCMKVNGLAVCMSTAVTVAVNIAMFAPCMTTEHKSRFADSGLQRACLGLQCACLGLQDGE